jgi:DNA end-binding protein Ku
MAGTSAGPPARFQVPSDVPHGGFMTKQTKSEALDQFNKDTGHRVRYRKVDEQTGDEVEQADIIKGYEVEKGHYIELTSDELEAVAIESRRTVEIDEFVPKGELDELYMRGPYFIVPDGEVGKRRSPSSVKLSARKE